MSHSPKVKWGAFPPDVDGAPLFEHERAREPLNPLPYSRGNTRERAEEELREAARGRGPTPDTEEVATRTHALLESVRGRRGHVLNVGHGVLPATDPECVAAFVETARSFRP